MPSTGAKVLTVNELSEYLRVHRSTIYRLLKKGQLPGFKIGSDWRVNVEVVHELRVRPGAGGALGETGGPPALLVRMPVWVPRGSLESGYLPPSVVATCNDIALYSSP